MKILAHTLQLLYPADTGSQIRSSQTFKHLSRLHDVTLVTFRRPEDTDEQVEQTRAACSRLILIDKKETPKFTPKFYAELAANMLSRYPYILQKYHDARMERTLRALVEEEEFDIVVCECLKPSLNLISLPFCPKALSQHNVESIIRKRHYQQAANPVAKVYLYLQWRKLFRYEKQAGVAFDHCIMISDQDSRTMAGEYGVHNCSTVPIGVDVDFFRPGGPEGDANDVVFTGSMDWLPNEDAVLYFAEKIMPLIRAEMPIKLWVVGRNPTRALLRLKDTAPDIEVTGTVDDVRPYVDRAKVCIVPLRIGGGVRIKIFEAMAMNKAIVSTSIGAEGLPVTDGENIILADEPELFARKVIELLRNPPARRRLGDAARAMVAEHCSWEASARQFADVCERIVEAHAKGLHQC